jgi:hypothetical protein
MNSGLGFAEQCVCVCVCVCGSTGLISQGYRENSKWYFVNVERGNIADKSQPSNIHVSFDTSSHVAIDISIFTFYSDQLVTDVETGILNTFF